MYGGIYCVYNGIRSEDLGIYFVHLSNELPNEPFLSGRKLLNERIIGNPHQYLFGFEYEPYRFNIVFYHENWTTEKIQEVQKWLGTPTDYTELYCTDNIDRIWYCLYTGEVYLKYNGQQGCVAFEMECSSPFSYSKYYTQQFDYTNNTSTATLEFNNLGQLNLYPEIEFTLSNNSDGNFSIVNSTNGGLEMEFTELSVNETVYIDCDPNTEEIITDVPTTYRYENHNGVFLSLVSGINQLQITGKALLKMRYRYTYL